jgi:hypothetical protein
LSYLNIKNENIFIVYNFLTNEECKEFIKLHDIISKRPLPHVSLTDNIGNLDNHPVAKRIQSFVEDNLKIKTELYECDLWKRDSGLPLHKHKPHLRIDNDLTTIIYLNDIEEGGEFYTEDIEIKPQAGLLITFDGMNVLHGVKHPSEPRYTIICWWKNTKFKDKDLNNGIL